MNMEKETVKGDKFEVVIDDYPNEGDRYEVRSINDAFSMLFQAILEMEWELEKINLRIQKLEADAAKGYQPPRY